MPRHRPESLRLKYSHLQIPPGRTDKVVLDSSTSSCSTPAHHSPQPSKVFNKRLEVNGFSTCRPSQALATLEELMSPANVSSASSIASYHFSVKSRLDNDRGTAILVTAGIYDACQYSSSFRTLLFGKLLRHRHVVRAQHNAFPQPVTSDERFKFEPTLNTS